MALSNKSLQQAKQVLQQIFNSGVDVIVTRATLDKKIELVKFPYLYDRHTKRPQNRTLYVSNQYDPIRYWLINNKFLTSSRNASGVYRYAVNKEAIASFLHSQSNTQQTNNTKNENKKVMTRKERVFRHIEDNGNAMRYTDIIKFAFEDLYGKGTFDKKKNRGFYSCAFTYYSYWSSRYSAKRKNIGNPKGHFVIPTRNGHLFKLSNGLWSVHRPLGWVRKDVDTVLVPEVENTNVLEDGEYQSMCDVLKKYNTTPEQLDDLAIKYYVEKQCDANSAYHFAYYDLLEKGGAISDTTKDLQKEIDELADRKRPEEKHIDQSEQKYMVVCDEDCCYEGIFSMQELQQFFNDKDPDDFTIIEAGNAIKLEKKVTTTFTIK